MTTEQLDTLDPAVVQQVKSRMGKTLQPYFDQIVTELRRLHAENQQLMELSLEEAKITGAGAERELRLMAELDKVKRITLRDEELLRQALEYLERSADNYPVGHGLSRTFHEQTIAAIKERLK